MLKVAEEAHKTDTGRQRQANEDSYFARAPLFAVADGMGGAQAGEVASGLAATAFREFHAADDLAPVERVAAIIKEANRRIYERARADAQASGMGTTITAALVIGERIYIGHVGDSRAYLLRDDSLEQLTEDHSLVADLLRSGRLTPQEAETHPQRSVITRALGTDPEVEVDAYSIEAKPGDVVLLCSDGLTTMIDDEAILRLVRESSGLDAAARALVKAANRSGGEDNITAVLFRLEAGEPVSRTQGNGHEEVSAQDLEDTLSGLELPSELPEPTEPTAVFRPSELAGWEPVQAPRRATASRPAPPAQRQGRWLRRFAFALLAVVLALAVIAAAFWGLSRANFVGANDEGRLTVYQGLPWELGAGINLYRARYVSRVQAVQLSPAERADLLDHDLMGYAEARELVRRYEEEAVP
jgi:PPM family protein phosphatase